MTLDEAINHCKSVAKKETRCGNGSCRMEHLQLAHWLEELRERREEDERNKLYR